MAEPGGDDEMEQNSYLQLVKPTASGTPGDKNSQSSCPPCGPADAEKAINAARSGFEASFAEKDFYNRQTKDEQHLSAILDFIPVRTGMKILDLGTGSGYLAFALAKRYPDVSVTGLDIVSRTLEENRKKAENETLTNIRFVSCNGIDLPFADSEFDIVVSRYALHHFPEIGKSISEVARVLKRPGCFFISDPAPNGNDTDGFIDEYMRVKKDGHIRFYSLDEWKRLCENSRLRFERSFVSKIRFPRKYEEAYRSIIAGYDRSVTDGYELKIENDEIYVTVQVNNILFSV
jgi:ubiquinone/menaquinone biosynthesis C-methylase UbiE